MRQLVSAIAQFHPSFPDDIKGCSPAEIEALQFTVGRTLPTSYAEFLRSMGHHTGGLAPFEADYRIDTLLRFHAKDPREPDDPLTIGVSRWGPFYEGEEASDYPVDLEEEDTQGPRLSAFVPWEKGALFPASLSFLNVVNPTLYEAFFAEAILKFHLVGLPEKRALVGLSKTPNCIEQTHSLLSHLGFSRHPESDCIGYYIHPGATILVNNDPPEMRLTLAVHNPMELRRLIETLSKRLSLTVASANKQDS
jgi:hypothetical protein